MPNYWDWLMGTDENAANYMHSYGEGVGTETREIIREFINEGESVLDIGCGPGWNMDEFITYKLQVKKYKGTDLSPRFVRVANKRRKENQYPVKIYVPFEVQDMRNMTEPDNSWDVVILQDALEHTNGWEESMSEAFRIARKRVIVSFWRMREDIQTKTNDDTDKGDDGYGSDYNQNDWELYLNTLPYVWFTTETSPKANRPHKFYIIDKELK